MQSLLRGAAKMLLLLVVIVLTARGSTLPPSTQPRLERTDITVLSIECRVPYHTAWMEGWNIPFAELQILYQGRYLNDKPEVVANLTSRNTKPAIYGRFRDADLFTATSVQLPETVEGCHSCRKIRVLMAVSGSAYYGYYSCEAKSTGKNSRAIYTALVDEQFVSHPQTKVNGTLKLESIRADDIHITWNDRLVKSSGSGEVSVERTVVDKEGQLLDNEATYILFRTVKDKPVPYENHGTLLFTKSGPDSEGQSEVRLVVEKDTLSSPLWRYSCQVSGNDCNRHSKSHTATPEDRDCNCDCGRNSLVTSLFIGLGIVSFLLIFCTIIFVLYCKLRKARPLRDDNHVVSYSLGADRAQGNSSGRSIEPQTTTDVPGNSDGPQTTPDNGPGNSDGPQTTPHVPGNSDGPHTTPDNGPGNSDGPQTTPDNGPGNSDGPQTTPDSGLGSSAGPQTTTDNGPGSSAGPQTTPDNGPGSSAGPQTTTDNGPGSSAGPQTTTDNGPGSSAGPQTTPDNVPCNSDGPQTTPDNVPGNSAGPQTTPGYTPGYSDGRLITTGNTPQNTVGTHDTRSIMGEKHAGTGDTDEGTDDDNSVGTEDLAFVGVQASQSDDNDDQINAGTPLMPGRLAHFRTYSV